MFCLSMRHPESLSGISGVSSNQLIRIYNIIQGFILHGLARKLYWLKPELIEKLSMISNFGQRFSGENLRDVIFLHKNSDEAVTWIDLPLCGIPSSANASTR